MWEREWLRERNIYKGDEGWEGEDGICSVLICFSRMYLKSVFLHIFIFILLTPSLPPQRIQFSFIIWVFLIYISSFLFQYLKFIISSIILFYLVLSCLVLSCLVLFFCVSYFWTTMWLALWKQLLIIWAAYTHLQVLLIYWIIFFKDVTMDS